MYPVMWARGISIRLKKPSAICPVVQMEAQVRRYVQTSHEEGKGKMGGDYLHFDVRLNDQALNVDRNPPPPLHRIPGEAVVRDRTRESLPSISSYLNASYTRQL